METLIPQTKEVLAKLSEAGRSCHSGQAKRDPESSPARSGIQKILDSGEPRTRSGVHQTLCLKKERQVSLNRL
jgi:hypothetical protein